MRRILPPLEESQTGVNQDPFRPLKNAFGRFATGVAIAACARGTSEARDGGGDFVAITINSFVSVSLHPPLILWCIENRASTFADFARAAHYSVSVLDAGQRELADRFARHEPRPLRAEEVETLVSGAPLIRERLAGFDCRVVDRHRSGDHVILVGEVLKFDSRDGAPLLYYASKYATGPQSAPTSS